MCLCGRCSSLVANFCRPISLSVKPTQIQMPRITVSDLLKQALAFYKENAFVLCGVVAFYGLVFFLLYVVTSILLRFALLHSSSWFLNGIFLALFILRVVVLLWGLLALLEAVKNLASGAPRAFAASLEKLPKFIITNSIFLGFVFIVVAVLYVYIPILSQISSFLASVIGIGSAYSQSLISFIVLTAGLGILAMPIAATLTKALFYNYVFVWEGIGGLPAFYKSGEYVSGRFWEVAECAAIVFVPLFVVAVMVDASAASVFGVGILENFVFTALSAAIAPFVAVYGFFLYDSVKNNNQ